MTPLTIVVVVAALLVIAAIVVLAIQSRRRAALHQRFGSEYERQVEGAPSRAEAEKHLTEVARRHDELDVKDLDDAQRGAFVERWRGVQGQFVDQPAVAVDGAHALVDDVLRARGYPSDDFEAQAELVAVDHADVVQSYRAAHEARERHRRTGQADTEDLRQAFVHYRALFESLTDQHPDDQHPDDQQRHRQVVTQPATTRIEESR